MKKAFRICVVFFGAAVALWLFPALSVAVSAPNDDVNLQLVKTSSPNPVIAGNVLTYTLTITNNGSLLASSVLLTDTLPTDVDYIAATNTCAYDIGPHNVTCTLGDIDLGSTASVTITVQVDPSIIGSIVNRASAFAQEPDLDPLDNSVEETTNVITSADLLVVKDDGVSQVTAGDGVTYGYVITVTNAGPSLASGVVVTDTWPVGFTRGLVESSLGSCDTLSDPQDYTCDVGALGVGESGVITASYTVPAGTAGGVYTNLVEAVTPEGGLVTDSDDTTVVTTAGLSIVKDDGVSQVTAGDGVTYGYVITVTNAGPSLASGVVVTDTWPVGFTRGLVESSLGSCDTLSDPQDYTCSVGALDAGQSGVITASYTVPAGTAGGVYTNLVEAVTPEGGLVTDSDDTTVVTTAGLSIVKDDGVSQVTAGDGVTYGYVITVTNAGPSLASGVVVTDTWPVGFTRGLVESSLGSCDTLSDPQDYTCDVGALGVGESGVITASYTVPAGTAGGVYTNLVEAVTPEGGLVTDSDDTTVVTTAGLSIVKDDGVSQVTAGDGVTYGYVITVTNAGPSLASGVVVTDTWPVGFTRGLVESSLGSCDTLSDPQDFTCDVGALGVGESGVITASYTVPAETAGGVYTNLVEAVTPEGGLVTDSDDTTVVTTAGLSIVKDDGVSQVTAGDGVTYGYVITVTNAGPSLASGVVVTDTWPVGFTRGLVESSLGSCDTLSDPQDYTCDVGALGVGESGVITASYTVPAETAGGVYTNLVEAVTPEGGLVTDSDDTTVVTTAGLSILKDDGVSQVTAGDGVTYGYVITVTNAGPSLASGVVVTDTWPVGFTRGLVESSLGSCDTLSDPQDYTCDVGALGVGESGVITASYTVPAETAGGVYTNLVEAVTPEGGLVTDSDDTTVVTTAGLSIVKDDGVSQVTAGDGVTYGYVITVTNAGPSLASGVVVTDTWPVGFTRGLVESSLGSCDTLSDPQDYTCDVGALGVGESGVITASYTVPAGTAGGVYTNLVEAVTPEGGLVTDSDLNIVILSANLRLWMMAEPSPAVSGGLITYTLVITNSGPVTAFGVILTDTLPAGLTFISTGSSVGCDDEAGPVSCDLGTMPSGNTRQVIIRSQISLSTAGIITNEANVESNTFDPDDTNNQSETSTTVVDLTLPTISWILPVTDEQSYDVKCQLVRLQADATDNIQVQRVRFYRWVPANPGFYLDIGDDFTAPYALNFYSCDLTLGYNQIFTEAYDTWANKSTRKRILLYKLSNEQIYVNYYLPVLAR